jgi:electron transfer DM13
MQVRVPIALRVLGVPATVAIVLVGLWVAGALLTNDFELAMLLTAGWMGLAGLIALGIAVRSRAFRWPVLGAYVVTAVVIGVYLGRSVFMDDVVNEQVATAAPAGSAPAPAQSSGQAAAPQPQNVLLRAGRFESVRHSASGKAQAIDLAAGGSVLTLTDFEVDNGPDLRLYLVAGPATTEGEVEDFVDLGGLKGNVGNQQYELPRNLDVGRHSTVVIWCRAFSVLFARAPLRA